MAITDLRQAVGSDKFDTIYREADAVQTALYHTPCGQWDSGLVIDLLSAIRRWNGNLTPHTRRMLLIAVAAVETMVGAAEETSE